MKVISESWGWEKEIRVLECHLLMFSVLDVENADNWHGKPIPKDKVESVLSTIQSQIQTSDVCTIQPPAQDVPPINTMDIKMPSLPTYKIGEKVLHGLSRFFFQYLQILYSSSVLFVPCIFFKRSM